eukprot:CAMPEP_0194047120 /NCGR_PEP_ID=MMETSP0009_2-20130614/23567_1 /TAXON_ID=210454 /ORGANISM="Grammatophora oceanica, Strain CCMP 410" /LENGTH=265 /DNA_ID=CAMNT_0038692639 /DNA_START=86 /DNA_END=883 /DNA_ORIENTATION=-
MPVKFSDIPKGPKDLLGDDYTSKISLKCKKSAGPVAVTIETERGSGGGLSSKVGTKFAYSGLSFDKAQMKADGGHVLETSIVPCPGCKVSFKGNKGADLGIDYSTGQIFATSVLDVKDMSKVSATAAMALPSGLVLGGGATYALSGKTGLSVMDLSASYATGPVFASITSSSKFTKFNVGLLYKVNPDLTLASQTTHSSSNTFDVVAVGGQMNTPFGKIKAKVGSSGIISGCLVKDLAPKVTLTASGSMPASDMSKFTYGFGIVM